MDAKSRTLTVISPKCFINFTSRYFLFRPRSNLLPILRYQVDNPVCIMDKEYSKLFFKGNEADRYKYRVVV